MEPNNNPLDNELQALRDRVRDLEAQLSGAGRKEAADAQAGNTRQQQEQQAFVQDLAARLSEAERAALYDWSAGMLALRQSGGSLAGKIPQAINLTISSKAALPTLKLLAREAKRRAWDRQQTAGRAVVGAGLIFGLLAWPGAIALSAAGVAGGFPLWVLLTDNGARLATALRDACITPPAPATPAPVVIVPPGDGG